MSQKVFLSLVLVTSLACACCSRPPESPTVPLGKSQPHSAETPHSSAILEAEWFPKACRAPADSFNHVPEKDRPPPVQLAKWVRTQYYWYNMIRELRNPPTSCDEMSGWVCSSFELFAEYKGYAFDRERCSSKWRSSVGPRSADSTSLCVSMFAQIMRNSTNLTENSAPRTVADEPGWCNGLLFAAAVVGPLADEDTMGEWGQVVHLKPLPEALQAVGDDPSDALEPTEAPKLALPQKPINELPRGLKPPPPPDTTQSPEPNEVPAQSLAEQDGDNPTRGSTPTSPACPGGRWDFTTTVLSAARSSMIGLQGFYSLDVSERCVARLAKTGYGKTKFPADAAQTGEGSLQRAGDQWTLETDIVSPNQFHYRIRLELNFARDQLTGTWRYVGESYRMTKLTGKIEGHSRK